MTQSGGAGWPTPGVGSQQVPWRWGISSSSDFSFLLCSARVKLSSHLLKMERPVSQHRLRPAKSTTPRVHSGPITHESSRVGGGVLSSIFWTGHSRAGRGPRCILRHDHVSRVPFCDFMERPYISFLFLSWPKGLSTKALTQSQW